MVTRARCKNCDHEIIQGYATGGWLHWDTMDALCDLYAEPELGTIGEG